MGFLSAVRSAFELPIEAAPAPLEPQRLPERKALEWGIPIEGTSGPSEISSQQTRRTHLEELHDLYLSCPPVAISVNAIARAVTAGGMVVVPDEMNPDADEPSPTPEVQRLKRLMRFTNPRENFIQLMRGVAADLLVFGDAFIEVSWQGDEPVALYSLDAPSMTVDADVHGQVRGYKQVVPGQRTPVEFEPEEIIHVSLDNPRGGLYGLSPCEQIQIPAAIWLFCAACLKETYRRGNPPRIHADHAKDQRSAVQRWFEQYLVRNLGPKNIGTPIVTVGGGTISELQSDKITDYLNTLRDMRDVISGTLGAPPNKVNIVESGNLGGGTGEAQDKNWRTVTIIPLQTLILEALNFQVVQRGFGIDGWHMEFVEVDYRDSTVIENIRQERVRLGAWSPNRYRREIGEPPLDGGDDALVMDRGKFIYLRDMALYTQAEMNQMNAPYVVALKGAEPPDQGAPPPPMPPGEAVRAEFERRYRAVIEETEALPPLPVTGNAGNNGHR